MGSVDNTRCGLEGTYSSILIYTRHWMAPDTVHERGPVNDKLARHAVQPELEQLHVLCFDKWSRASSIMLILPLWLPKDTYPLRKKHALDATVAIGDKHVPFWEPFSFSSALLLPHVRRYLNTGGDGTTGTLLSANPSVIDWLNGPREADSCWTLHLPNHNSVRFRLLQAHLLLYRLDIAFICLEIRANSDLPADWFNLLHYARFITGSRARKVHVTTRELAHTATALKALAAPANAAIVRNNKQLTVILPSLAPIFDIVLSTATLHGEPQFPLTQNINGIGLRVLEEPGVEGQLLAYPCLMFARREDAMANANLGALLVSRAKGAHHAAQRISSFETTNATEGILPYADGQWLFASSEGGGFVAIQNDDMVASPDGFQSGTLPSHIRRDYFFTFSYSAFQRFALIRLSEEVASHTLESKDRFSAVHNRVLEFTGRGLFLQISQSQHHHRYYDLALRIHQVSQLHDEVCQEVDAFREYQQSIDRERRERQSRKAEILLGVVTGIVIPMQLVAALFPSSVSAWPYLKHINPNWQAGGALILAITLIGFTTSWLLRGSRNSKE